MSRTKGSSARPVDGLVLDCSIVGAWYLDDKSNDYADEVARHLAHATAHVPQLGIWRLPTS